MDVRLTDVVKRFKGVQALDGVSVHVAEGEFFTLLGPSGCGKTSTLRVIAGFYDPDEGTVHFGDTLMLGVPPAERGIGIVFQNYALWPHMTVHENVAYGLKIQHVAPVDIGRRVAASLRQVGLEGLEGRAPGQLSGGQQQRVAVARALVLNPRVLLLDEPLSNLDAKVRARLRSEIRRLQQELRITTIYVTHDQEEALVLSDRIAVMDAGRIQQVGPPGELYERPASLFVADFIGTNNFLSGTVVDASAGYAIIRTPSGDIRGTGRGEIRPGTRATTAVRPENVELFDGSESPPAGGSALQNHLRGRVVLFQFMGSVLRYEVEIAGNAVMKIDIHDPKRHRPLAPGTEVVLGFAANAAAVYSADPSRTDRPGAAGA